ncbi:DUF1599 domain-containing protein [Apibacter muscae]|uniref:DUF1599 domain-containing protein n=1 Tax=Apibacter muscae TaxID=2509004 RepID=UPI0011AC463C|nr:DUF1599 domain-containing protein [Apibacter muscae]TWP28147.1 DUF1599 domain-containing protein [Apibacter muscae]
MSQTSHEFDTIINNCQTLFKNKMLDYGAAWRILRLPSLTDQIYIKANRIRTIQEKGEQKVEENIDNEFIAIVNYSIMSLIQLEKGVANQPDLSVEQALEWYVKKAEEAKNLMLAKNHDYGEAWRDLRISSITDLILQKLLRVKQIEDNMGKTIVSEGLEANYFDIVNYAVFALILLNNQGNNK